MKKKLKPTFWIPKRAYAKQHTFIWGIVSMKTKQTQLSTIKKNFYLARQKQVGGTYRVNRCKQCKNTAY